MVWGHYPSQDFFFERHPKMHACFFSCSTDWMLQNLSLLVQPTNEPNDVDVECYLNLSHTGCFCTHVTLQLLWALNLELFLICMRVEPGALVLYSPVLFCHGFVQILSKTCVFLSRARWCQLDLGGPHCIYGEEIRVYIVCYMCLSGCNVIYEMYKELWWRYSKVQSYSDVS
jgi:hypothetical protein